MPFEERYSSGNTPWEIDRADRNLIEMVKTRPIGPGKALDIGCGTGNNAIWLTQQGFAATGVDCVALAIDRARDKAAAAKVDCPFYVLDFLADDIPGRPYDFAFDRGCFHHFQEAEKLARFATKVAAILKDRGLWLSLAGSADETREGPGPPQLTAGQIVTAVEPLFEIIALTASHFDSNQAVPPRNWVCLLRKR